MSKQENSQIKQAQVQEKNAPGGYIYPIETVPPEVRNTITERFGNKIELYTPRENGHYKGQVLYNGETHLAQALGAKGNRVVIHRKDDLEFKSEDLQKRDETKRLQTTTIQVHYTKDKADVFPWNREKEQEKLYYYESMRKANEYAKVRYTNEKEQTAFLKEFEQALTHKIEEPQKAQPAQEKQNLVVEKESRDFER